ncbi:tyrosinase family protein [Bacillus sp. FJAT-51639]|uniref:Tyrosinase family protein n=1 Tax=Bacillus bruguierae TaxID=3127667 RepID=A0ABU8FF18_9BACI
MITILRRIACRRNARTLTDEQKRDYVKAVLELKSSSQYNQYVLTHNQAAMRPTPSNGDPNQRNAAHNGPAFFPWHREFLRRFEQDLRNKVPGIAIPYWEWTIDHENSSIWNNDFMGGNGDPGDNNLVKTGPFAVNNWTTIDENGNPAGGLSRAFGQNPSASSLPSQTDLDGQNGAFKETQYDSAPWDLNSSQSFRNHFEVQLHNLVHRWVGGSMLPMTSPNDPVFFLHHCMVDKCWADWQKLFPNAGYVPTGGGPEGHNLNDAMFPWPTRPADVLNHRQLGYLYDTDPPFVQLKTPNLVFNDVPEGVTTVRAIVFEVTTCKMTRLEIVSGPGTGFGTPESTFEIVDPGAEGVVAEARIWISYTGTRNGDKASGSVTLRDVETGEQWTVPISANTVTRPKAAAVLVLDQSNSMNFDSGFGPPLKTRSDVLKYSLTPFIEQLQDDNGIGIVRFDQDAFDIMPVTTAGPNTTGVGRTTASSDIQAYAPNPNGWTSIGNGIEHAHTLLTQATGYDVQATIVFTDGEENRPKFIADVKNLINERVYGIGLGTPEQINPAALTALTNGTGGYLLLTGALNQDETFRLSKYFLQILSGVNNRDIVVDPEGWLGQGQVHRIPFQLVEADISSDIVLLSPNPNPSLISFKLEAPDGSIIEPKTTGIPGLSFVIGDNISFYRMSLPVLVNGKSEYEGTWHAILEIPEEVIHDPIPRLGSEPITLMGIQSHGLHYNLSVTTFSNLNMRAYLIQNSYEPGATFMLRAILTEYGLPVNNRSDVKVELIRPDQTKTTLTMTETEPGIFEISLLAAMPGVYQFRVLAVGSTMRGRPFTREQLLTGAVWKGGDSPLPSSDTNPTSTGNNPGNNPGTNPGTNPSNNPGNYPPSSTGNGNQGNNCEDILCKIIHCLCSNSQGNQNNGDSQNLH